MLVAARRSSSTKSFKTGGAACATARPSLRDIALHILAGTGTAAPETYAEALSALAADAVIPGSLGARLSQAVRLRNILVHGYLDIDHGRLFDELEWIESTEEFAAAIEQWLERNVDQ